MALPSPVARTKAMLDCIGFLPLDILYAACPRPDAGADCAGRWIPSAPGDEPLVETTLLRVQDEGLVLHTEYPTAYSDLFVIDFGLVGPQSCFSIGRDSSKEWYLVQCRREITDHIPRRLEHAACLVMERSFVDRKNLQTPPLRGALLQIIEESSDPTPVLSTRYDCPLTFSIRRQPPGEQEPISTPMLQARKLATDTKIVIEHIADADGSIRFVQRRKHFCMEANVPDGRHAAVSCGSLAISTLLGYLLIYLVYLLLRGSVDPMFDTDTKLIVLAIVFTLTFAFLMILVTQAILEIGVLLQTKRTHREWVTTFEDDWRPTRQSYMAPLRGVARPRWYSGSGQRRSFKTNIA